MAGLTAYRSRPDLFFGEHAQRGAVDEHELPQRCPRNDVERGPEDEMALLFDGVLGQQLIDLFEDGLFGFRDGLPGKLAEVLPSWLKRGRFRHGHARLRPVLAEIQLVTRPNFPHALHLEQLPNTVLLAAHKVGTVTTVGLETGCSAYAVILLKGHQEPVQAGFEGAIGVALDPFLGPLEHVLFEPRILLWEDAVLWLALQFTCLNMQKGAAGILGEGQQDGRIFVAELRAKWQGAVGIETPATSYFDRSEPRLFLLAAKG